MAAIDFASRGRRNLVALCCGLAGIGAVAAIIYLWAGDAGLHQMLHAGALLAVTVGSCIGSVLYNVLVFRYRLRRRADNPAAA